MAVSWLAMSRGAAGGTDGGTSLPCAEGWGAAACGVAPAAVALGPAAVAAVLLLPLLLLLGWAQLGRARAFCSSLNYGGKKNKINGGFATYGTTYNICIMNNISATYCNICANERGASAACCRHVARMLHACCIYMMFRLQATKERRWKIRQRGQKTHTPPPKHTHPTTPHHECATLATKEDRGGA